MYNPSEYLLEQREQIKTYFRSLFYSSITEYEYKGIIVKDYRYINLPNDSAFVLTYNSEFIIKYVTNISDNKEDDEHNESNWIVHTLFIDHKYYSEIKRFMKTYDIFVIRKPIVSLYSLYAIFTSYAKCMYKIKYSK